MEECKRLLIEAGAVATPIPKVQFLVGKDINEMHKQPCLAASEFVRTFFTTSVGHPGEYITLEGAAPDRFEYIQFVVEEKLWKLPNLKDKGQDCVLEVITLSNQFLFEPVQKCLARKLLKDKELWTDNRSEWKDQLQQVFATWYRYGTGKHMRIPRQIRETFASENWLDGALFRK
jgi:hypothetical protein